MTYPVTQLLALKKKKQPPAVLDELERDGYITVDEYDGVNYTPKASAALAAA